MGAFLAEMLWLALLVLAACGTLASNPIVLDTSIADPHIRIFDGSAYMYAGRDADPHAPGFEMPDWTVWRSNDLVNWENITTILPTQTYIAKQDNQCWASDVVPTKDGSRYAFFFSHGGISMGVMTASSPTLADATDALHRPLVSSTVRTDYPTGVTITSLTRGAYDPTVLVDDDPDATTYLCFGVRDNS